MSRRAGQIWKSFFNVGYRLGWNIGVWSLSFALWASLEAQRRSRVLGLLDSSLVRRVGGPRLQDCWEMLVDCTGNCWAVLSLQLGKVSHLFRVWRSAISLGMVISCYDHKYSHFRQSSVYMAVGKLTSSPPWVKESCFKQSWGVDYFASLEFALTHQWVFDKSLRFYLSGPLDQLQIWISEKKLTRSFRSAQIRGKIQYKLARDC